MPDIGHKPGDHVIDLAPIQLPLDAYHSGQHDQDIVVGQGEDKLFPLVFLELRRMLVMGGIRRRLELAI